MKNLSGMLVLMAVTVGAALAATPPSLINYQGVLRDNNDKPLSGSRNMIFALYDAPSGGNQILVDAHDLPHGNAVGVSGGLFTVQLGGGGVSDGSGPGTYTSIEQVFRNHSEVYLEVRVGGETLSPRTQVLASAYALNAHSATELNGEPSDFYVNTGPDWQWKSGAIRLQSSDTGHAALDAVHIGPTATAAGYFEDSSFSGRAWIAEGNAGITASGSLYGGQFINNGAGGGMAVRAQTSAAASSAGEFVNLAHGTVASLGSGNGAAVSCFDGPSVTTYVCAGGYGIQGYGNAGGGYFDSTAGSGVGYAAFQDEGFVGYGNLAGGSFFDLDSSGWARVGHSTAKIMGNGAVSFVQNHPHDPGKVIVYAAPEGDEVAVYTRGTAQLVDGEARVPLGETFALVADPDIGLTAFATPTGDPIPLSIVKKSTSEIVVRGPAGSGASFDYIVWGLRIGFEQLSIVRPKVIESPVPAMNDHEEIYAEDASLRRFNALERFKAMRPAELRDEPLDQSRAEQLLAAVGVYDRERHGTVEELSGIAPPVLPDAAPVADAGPPAMPSAPAPTGPRKAASAAAKAAAPAKTVEAEPAPRPAWLHALPASVSIEAGQVVALDPERPGFVKPADAAAEGYVVGVAVAASANGTVEVAAAIAEVRVDAGYGSIVPGDLLTSSPTPGAAMRALDPEAAILGQALEPLEVGIGTIRMLLVQR